MTTDKDVKEVVGERYAQIARAAQNRSAASCCAPSESPASGPISGQIYTPEELKEVPADAALASLGCGNPVALAELHPGEVVLDLGSGGGIDVLLSARRVGPTGKAYGLDMVDEMLELARQNQRQAGIENVEFLKGEMEDIPLPDESVDVIISNCVVNLSPNKDKVFREAFRVLKPGGRIAVSDLVARGELPEAVRQNLSAWAACVAGALQEEEYLQKLADAGFQEVGLEVERTFGPEDAGSATCQSGYLIAAFIRAQKPAGASVAGSASTGPAKEQSPSQGSGRCC